MKKTQILHQTYEVKNGFDDKACITAINSILQDKIFKELINSEKDSLTVEFKIFVNEEEEIKIDKNIQEAFAVVDAIKQLTKEQIKDYGISSIWFKTLHIETK